MKRKSDMWLLLAEVLARCDEAAQEGKDQLQALHDESTSSGRTIQHWIWVTWAPTNFEVHSMPGYEPSEEECALFEGPREQSETILALCFAAAIAAAEGY